MSLRRVGAGKSDLLLGHLGLEFVVEAVGGDEKPVVLGLQFLHSAMLARHSPSSCARIASSVAPFSPGRSKGRSRKSQEVSKLSQSARARRIGLMQSFA